LTDSSQHHKAVVLLSGGLDSATTLAHAIDEGFRCFAVSFDYGQRHRRELDCARQLAEKLGAAEHRIVTLDPALFAGSALMGGETIPLNRDLTQIGDGIPTTYVPARNTVFLAMALAVAEQIGAFDIFIGANAIDYSGYPDCRPAYLDAFAAMANLATKAAVEGAGKYRIHAPLLNLTKGQIIRWAVELNVDMSLTNSCYNPDDTGRACGKCDSCILRRKGFAEAGIDDPVEYQQ